MSESFVSPALEPRDLDKVSAFHLNALTSLIVEFENDRVTAIDKQVRIFSDHCADLLHGHQESQLSVSFKWSNQAAEAFVSQDL